MPGIELTGTSAPAGSALLVAAGNALRMLAADERCRDAFGSAGSWLRALFAPAARRYVVADDQEDLLWRLDLLRHKNYRVSVEFVGEEISDPVEIERVVQEYVTLLQADSGTKQLGFDLSNVGLLVSRKLAIENTSRILATALTTGNEVVLSMERSAFADQILEIFMALAAEYDNVGITLQAHLYRTRDDLDRVLATGRKIRLVKGAYAEPAGVALPRGAELDRHYLRLAEYASDRGGRICWGTHDEKLLTAAENCGLLHRAEEIEMLHGVQPALLRKYREAGYRCRVYVTYGQNWWLHLLHRLAEHPPMVLTALADMAGTEDAVFGADY